jgi:hypothetical protein
MLVRTNGSKPTKPNGVFLNSLKKKEKDFISFTAN